LRSRHWTALLIAALGALLLALAACGDGEDGGVSTATATASPASTVAASPEATTTGEATPTASRQDSGADTGAPVYIALGDSLAAGDGASDPSSTAYVPLFYEYLQGALDIPDLALVNLGHGGDTSADLIEHGHLAKAVDEIRARNFDESPDNDVEVVTLDIGGNDLLGLFFALVIPGTCPDVETFLAEEKCLDAFQEGLDGLRDNFDQALSELVEADPELPVLTADLYNPFSGSGLPLDELAESALEGRGDSPVEEGLNDVIRSIAGEHGVPVADWYGAFEGKSAELVAPDHIHANDAGYRAMTDALIAAYGAGGN
jgi:lysophospholipase L1-like esterase